MVKRHAQINVPILLQIKLHLFPQQYKAWVKRFVQGTNVARKMRWVLTPLFNEF